MATRDSSNVCDVHKPMPKPSNPVLDETKSSEVQDQNERDNNVARASLDSNDSTSIEVIENTVLPPVPEGEVLIENDDDDANDAGI